MQEPQGEVLRLRSRWSVEGRIVARVERAMRCIRVGLTFRTKETLASSRNSNARRETVFSTTTTSGLSATILATAILMCSRSWYVKERIIGNYIAVASSGKYLLE